jgi:hypothetical protein
MTNSGVFLTWNGMNACKRKEKEGRGKQFDLLTVQRVHPSKLNIEFCV